ncbi:hypothetical protein Tdes44962_MAKER05117 [Teratosphaeria destructans]|uniref:Uncharacterized protein n=1 Tax=Teratosphaeria destructans TaxID=418781 RepID=A0A9W7SKS0_9PEZI|nr:hypothetical protein Tdes44962_MAKER05117 [Teratosphaeria destructans]
MANQPLQNITIVYYHTQDVNLMFKTTGTYTTTFSRPPGVHTLWPMVYNPDDRPAREREVLALPVTVLSGGTGYMTTYTKPLEPAVKSRPHDTAMPPKPTSDPVAPQASEKEYAGMVFSGSTSGWQAQGLCQEAVAKLGPYGTIVAMLSVALLLQTGFQWIKRRVRAQGECVDEESRVK